MNNQARQVGEQFWWGIGLWIAGAVLVYLGYRPGQGSEAAVLQTAERVTGFAMFLVGCVSVAIGFVNRK